MDHRSVLPPDLAQALIESSPAAIVVLDLNGHVLVWNRAAEHLFGWTAAEALGCFPPPNVPPDQQAAFLAWLPQGRQQPYQRDVERIHKDGTRLKLRVLSAPVRDQDGRVIGIMGVHTDNSARLQAETELNQQQQLLQAIIDNIPVMIAFFSADGRFRFVNREWLRLLGWNVAEMNDHPDIMAAFYPDPAYRQEALEYMLAAEPGWREFATINKSGELLYTAWANVRLPNGSSIGFGQDITDLKRQADELQRQVELMRLLLESIPFGYIYLEAPSGRTISYNSSAASILGHPIVMANSIADNQAYQGYHLDGRPYELDDWSITKALKSGKPVLHIEMQYRRGDGRMIRLLSSAIPVRDASGTMIGVVNLFEDISERKAAEEQLIRQNQFIESILDHLPIGLAVNDSDTGVATYINRRFAAIYGWPADELRDIERFFERVYPDSVYRALIRDRMMGDIASGDTARMHWNGLKITTKDGRNRIIEATTIPLPEQNLMIATVQDITERIELEARLMQAQKMESIGRLAGGIAHDFNNLLVPIIGYLEMSLLDLPSDGKLYEDLQLVLSAAERAGDLTQQILAFSRQQVLEMRALDLNELVLDFQKMLRRLVSEDIALNTLLDSQLAPITADKGQIEQVLLNLVVNARDAMPHGGKLTIETANVHLDRDMVANYLEGLPPGPYVMLAISDTGHGMDAETRKLIFEPFFTTKERGKGTGLGLATVFGIIRQHQGGIFVYSEPERGAIFKIYLPQATNTASTQVRAEHPPVEQAGSETILVVEDDDMVRRLVCESLASQGYQVLEAAHPHEGIARADAHPGPIDLLLSDVIMPDLNGLALYRQLLRVRPELKVLFMSGYASDIIVRDSDLHTYGEFLQKPFTIRELALKVRRALAPTV